MQSGGGIEWLFKVTETDRPENIKHTCLFNEEALGERLAWSIRPAGPVLPAVVWAE